MRVTWAAYVAAGMLVCGVPPGARPAAAAEMSVYGRPPLGAFGIETLEHVLACDKLGMTLVFTYSARGAGRAQLDVTSPMGKALAERKMKAMYNLSRRFTDVRLSREVAPQDDTIPTLSDRPESMDAFPPAGTLVIEGERIAYEERTREGFRRCRRGTEGTGAAVHHSGLWLCNSEGLKQDILGVKDSPNLWGFWLVDDARPMEGDCLKEMAHIIRLYDRRVDGTPYGHVIVMGVGGASAMENFSPGICDALGVYLYPFTNGKLNESTRAQLRIIMAQAKGQQPDIGLIGIPQAFVLKSSSWNVTPTPEQVRDDMLAYLAYGAAGMVPFMYHWPGRNGEPQGFDAVPALCEAVAKAYAEIRAGTLKPGTPNLPKAAEWHTVLEGAAARTPAGRTLFDYGDADAVAVVAKAHPAGRITPEPLDTEGRHYPVRMSVPRFVKGDPKSDEWPWIRIPEGSLKVTDWSGFRYLAQPVYNPSDHTVALAVDVKGGTGRGWAQYSLPIPPRTPVLLRIPIAELALQCDVAHVQHWRVWFSAPPEDITIHLGNPVLVGETP